MSYRRRAAKPRVALWMLVAIGDVALILVSVGMVAVIALASVVTIAVAAVGVWRFMRQVTPEREPVPAPVRVATMAPRRRA